MSLQAEEEPRWYYRGVCSQTQCQPQLLAGSPRFHGQTSSGLVPALGWMKISSQTAKFTHSVPMEVVHMRACHCVQAEPHLTHVQAAREQRRQEPKRRQHAVLGCWSPACTHACLLAGERGTGCLVLFCSLWLSSCLLPVTSRAFFPMTNSPSMSPRVAMLLHFLLKEAVRSWVGSSLSGSASPSRSQPGPAGMLQWAAKRTRQDPV